ncbi:amino acid ABC transporter permease [Jiangella sp. DSM 45060]|uniref:amino acid ABC transporter permease n=1 Tax=Jiangella sp. DSM 45060 TaxID=1798224 RepID=UPI00087D2A9B|nr:amino acid ABC transporter permease [Jiangella sp. DSM 45060]SDS72246.1 amino acid ABC transporter membrane protein 2, PAAT family [Jiangella sp. DSM 45060]
MSSILYDAPGPRTRRRTTIYSIIGALFVLGLGYLAYRQLDSRDQWDPERWQIFTDPPLNQTANDVWTSLLVDGLGATLRAAGIAAVIALAAGVLLAVLRMSGTRWVRWPVTTVIEFFRGLPVVLLMFFGVIAIGLPIFWGVVFGLVIYNSAIFAEILRAGIVSLPKGQSEASYAIGLSRWQTLFTVLLPQAVRRMLPSLVSQLVVLLKDTSLGFIIGYAELLRRLQLNTQFFGQRYWFQFFVVGAAIYIAVNFTLSRLAVYLERRGTSKAAGGVAKADDAAIGGSTATGVSV